VRDAPWWALVGLLTVGGVGWCGAGVVERQLAWMQRTALGSDAAGEAERLSRTSEAARRAYDEETRQAVAAEAAQRQSGERTMRVGAVLTSLGAAVGAWRAVWRRRERRTPVAR
jgi:hypothetical protein